MPSSRITSPSRSQGVISTPRRHKPRRRTRSVSSPAPSNLSVRLSTIVSNSFKVSPMPNRQSVLTDVTDIEIQPGRKSWWKRLGENSREIMDVLESKDIAQINNVADEFDVEVLSQEKRNYTLDLPESSDGESISSIVIPQRKLFTQKDNNPQKKFAQIMNNRDSQKRKSQTEPVKDIDVVPKNLFSQPKQRNKPVFPSGLLNISTNKTLNKTKDMPAPEVKSQVRTLFGNRAAIKRKNMFADFIVSDSEDDISDIQPKVFAFKKNVEECRESTNSRAPHHSPTSSIDLEMDDWKLLPSSTMVGNQLEDITPVKRARLSKLSEVKESETISTINKTMNKTKQSNKSMDPKNKSKISSNSKLKNVETLEQQDVVMEEDPNLSNSRITRNKSKSIREISLVKTNRSKTSNTSKNNTMKDKSVTKNISLNKNAGNVKQNIEVQPNLEDNNKSDQNISIRPNENEMENNENEPNDNENFTLEYENDDENIEDAEVNTSTTNALKNKNDTVHQLHNKIDVIKSKESTINILNKSSNKNITYKHDNDMVDGEATEKVILSDNQKVPNVIVEKQSRIVSQIADNINTVNVSQHNKSKRHNTTVNKENRSMNTDNKITKDTKEQHSQSSSNKHENRTQPDNEKENEAEESDNQMDAEINEESNESGNEKQIVSQEIQNESDEHSKQIVSEQEPNESDSQNETDDKVDKEVDDERKNETNGEEKDSSNEVQDEQDDEEDMEVDNEQQDESDDAVTSDEEQKDEVSENLPDEDQEDVDESENETENNDVEQNESEAEEIENNDEKNGTENNDIESENEIEDNDEEQIDAVDQNEQHNEDNDAVVNEAGSDNNESPNVTNEKEEILGVTSPEAVLHDKTNQIDSFTAQGRNTTARKSKSILIKNLNIRPSLAPVRESTGFSDGTRDSSADNSGWDSHRTTRKTLRQTFGKDFTLRKSLRALVMEKSAKRHTNFMDKADLTEVDNTKAPQANSTELPHFESYEEEPMHVDETPEQVSEVREEDKEPEEDEERQDDNECVDSEELEVDEEREEDNECEESEVRGEDEECEEDNECDETEVDEKREEDNECEVTEEDEEREEDNECEVTEEDEEREEDNECEVTEEDEERDEDNECEDNEECEASDVHGESEEYEGREEVNESEEDEVHEEEYEEREASEVREKREESKRKRQTTLEMYLQKIKEENMEKKRKMEEQVRNSLKTTQQYNPFKVPRKPVPRIKTIDKSKKKIERNRLLHSLPAEVIEDMKYKPPKRFQPNNASWITKRLYKFLETKLEPKYDYKARVRAEKLVETIYNFTKEVRKHDIAPSHSVDILKNEMARLDVVKTHFDFYEFFHNYMPREIRIKVVPDVVNKISLPKHGVFAEIIR